MRLLMAICFFQFQRASSQFPEHTDFQKLGEVFYKGEKYNILKETTHSVRDHFKDFMQRRESEDFPTKKVFLDKNGFRHYWSGLYDKENFRKVGTDRENKADIKSETRIKYGEFKSKQEEIAGRIKRKLNKVDKIIMKPILQSRKSAPTTGTKNKTHAESKPKAEVKPKTKEADKPKAKKVLKLSAKVDVNTKAKEADKKIIMTQFFCPYFGVMTLTSALD